MHTEFSAGKSTEGQELELKLIKTGDISMSVFKVYQSGLKDVLSNLCAGRLCFGQDQNVSFGKAGKCSHYNEA